MNQRCAFLLLTVAVLVSGGCAGGAVPSASSSASTVTSTAVGGSAPSPAASQPPTVPAIGAELPPGTYRSDMFATPVTFTLPAGWKVFEDETGQFGLALVANDGPCLCVWRDVRAMSTSCEEQPDPGAGTTATAIAARLEERPGIVATAVQPVDLGGLHGTRLDIAINPRWTKTCPFSQGRPAVPTLVGSGISTGVAWDVEAGDPQRLYLLDLPWRTGNLAVMVDVCCGADWDERIAAATPVVSSFSFAS